MSKAKPSFVILRFDIRYSAVLCLIQIIEAASLVIKKTFHFGVVSYEASAVNTLMVTSGDVQKKVPHKSLPVADPK